MDTVKLNIPLLIRILELAKEDIKDDADLHILAEILVTYNKSYDSLSMAHYQHILDKLHKIKKA